MWGTLHYQLTWLRLFELRFALNGGEVMFTGGGIALISGEVRLTGDEIALSGR